MANLSISDAWVEAKAVVAREADLLSAVALALFVLPGVISDVVTPTGSEATGKVGWWTAVSIVALVVTLVGQLAIIRLAIGGRIAVGEAIGRALRRAPVYVVALLIWVVPFAVAIAALATAAGGSPEKLPPAAALAIFVVLVLFIVLAARMIMSTPVASAEDVGPFAILKRSWTLTSGHWLKLLGFLILYAIGALILVWAVDSVTGVLAKLLFGGLEPLSLGALLASIVRQVVAAGVAVLLMTLIARIYVQLARRASASGLPSSGT